MDGEGGEDDDDGGERELQEVLGDWLLLGLKLGHQWVATAEED